MGIGHLYQVRRDVLGDGQIPGEGRIAVILVNGLVGGQAANGDEEFLKAIALAELAQGFGMAVVEVLVAYEDIVVKGFGPGEIFAE